MNLEKIDYIPLDATIHYENISVKGKAKVSLKSKTCVFSSDFVPLLHLNSEVTVITSYNGENVFKVKGPVFLSSKKFMRLQPITVSLYNGAERVIEVATNIHARCTKKHFFSTIYDNCQIVSCSADKMSISGVCLTPERKDNKIDIEVGKPLFDKETKIELEFDDGGMLFGEKKCKAKYLYRIISIDNKSHISLLKYIRAAAIEEIKSQWRSNPLEVYNLIVFR